MGSASGGSRGSLLALMATESAPQGCVLQIDTVAGAPRGWLASHWVDVTGAYPLVGSTHVTVRELVGTTKLSPLYAAQAAEQQPQLVVVHTGTVKHEDGEAEHACSVSVAPAPLSSVAQFAACTTRPERESMQCTLRLDTPPLPHDAEHSLRGE